MPGCWGDPQYQGKLLSKLAGPNKTVSAAAAVPPSFGGNEKEERVQFGSETMTSFRTSEPQAGKDHKGTSWRRAGGYL
jgi:hypothetical protein